MPTYRGTYSVRDIRVESLWRETEAEAIDRMVAECFGYGVQPHAKVERLHDESRADMTTSSFKGIARRGIGRARESGPNRYPPIICEIQFTAENDEAAAIIAPYVPSTLRRIADGEHKWLTVQVPPTARIALAERLDTVTLIGMREGNIPDGIAKATRGRDGTGNILVRTGATDLVSIAFAKAVAERDPTLYPRRKNSLDVGIRTWADGRALSDPPMGEDALTAIAAFIRESHAPEDEEAYLEFNLDPVPQSATIRAAKSAAREEGALTLLRSIELVCGHLGLSHHVEEQLR